MPSLKKTALNHLHHEYSAKLVDFSGYELPVQYRGIRDEHCHTREKASLFDISHMGQIRLRAANLTTLTNQLESLIPNSISNLAEGHQRYSVLLNTEAGVIDDIMISRYGDDLLLVVNAACVEKDLKYLANHLDDAIQIQLLQERTLIAIQGPLAATILCQLNSRCAELSFMQCGVFDLESTSCFISRSGYTGEDGFEISIPSEHVESIVLKLLEHSELSLAGLGARDTLRLEAGLCLYGHELTETTTPLEANLDWIISKQKLHAETHYLGKTTIQQQIEKGIDRMRVGLVVEHKMPVREGSKLLDANQNPVGDVTSGSFSPSLNKPIAMGYVDRRHAALETELLAVVRQKTIPVTVSKLPFVPHKYHR